MSFESWQAENRQLTQEVGAVAVQPTKGFESWKEENEVARAQEISQEGSILRRIYGASMRGWMKLGEAAISLPAHIVGQAKFFGAATIADEVLAAKDPEIRKQKLKDLKTYETTMDKFKSELMEIPKLHKQGQRIIESRHPEWKSDPPDSFLDLLTSPDKLFVSLAESLPILVSAGVLASAGQSHLASTLMFAAEGQQAYDEAIRYGATEEQAENTYLTYGVVAGALEQMQLEGVMKIGKDAYNHILNRTTQKVAKAGYKSLTREVIKTAAQEAIEEMSQGTWQEATAAMIYGKKPEGGLLGFVDRRAQEALIGGVMGLIPGIGGASIAHSQNLYVDAVSKRYGITPEQAQSAVDVARGEVRDDMTDEEKKETFSSVVDLQARTSWDENYKKLYQKLGRAPTAEEVMHDVIKASGMEEKGSRTTYAQARKSDNNPHVTVTGKPSKDKTLLVQFSSDLLTEGREDPGARAYYDKLHTMDGYEIPGDFWEVPTWLTVVAGVVKDSDLYVIRSIEKAKEFLADQPYTKIFLSALEVNKDMIKEIAENFDGEVVVGGYVDPAFFADNKNVKFYDTVENMAKGEGYKMTADVDYRHFKETKTQPRLCMSKGCLHKCAFCTVAKGLELTPTEIIDQQIDAWDDLETKLVYLDDKTFGQAENYKDIIRIRKKISEKHPEFQGFIIQTTATQFNKFDEKFLYDAGIQYVELGIESFNDPILKKLHKPITEKTILEAAEKLKRAGISFIPNIIIGIPEETPASYQRTLDFLDMYKDTISHVNIYNLALYSGTELGDAIEEKTDTDLNENEVAKSFHENPEVHLDFAEKIYAFAEQQLDRTLSMENKSIAPTPDGEIGKKYGVTEAEVKMRLATAERKFRELKNKPVNERTKAEKDELTFLKKHRTDIEKLLDWDTAPMVPKKMSRKKALALGHKLPKMLGLTEEDRRDIMGAITGVRSMKQMTPAQREQIVNYFIKEAREAGLDVDAPEIIPANELANKLRERVQKPKLSRRDKRNMNKLKKILNGMRSGTNFYFLNLTRIKRLCRALDNYQDNGPFMQYIYRPVKEADTQASIVADHVMDSMAGAFRETGIDVPAMMTEVIDIDVKDNLTTAERIGVYALAQNEKTMKHLLSEFTEEEVTTIIESVEKNPNEVEVAQAIQAYFEMNWPEFRRIAESVGIENLIKEENYITAFIVDKDALVTPDFFEGLIEHFTGKPAVPGEKHTIERTGKGRANLELNIFMIHARAARALERFKAMAPAADSVGGILRNKEFRTALNDATHGHGVKLMDKWLQDSVRGSAVTDRSPFGKALRWMRVNATSYVLGAKILLGAKQGISALTAAAVHPAMVPAMFSNLIKASTISGYNQLEKIVMSKSNMVATRDWDRDLRQVFNKKAVRKAYAGKKLSPMMMRMATWVDRHTVIVTWHSAYEVAQNNGLDEKASRRYADGIIEDTQPMGKAVDLPGYFRGGELAKNLTIFQNFVNQNGNFLWYDILGERKADKISTPMMAYRLMVSQILPAILLGMISRGRPPRDPKEFAEDIGYYMLSPYLVIGRGIYNLYKGEWGPGGFMSLTETPLKETERLVKAIRSGNKRNILRYGARTAGAWTGKIPLQAITTAEGAWDLASGESEDIRELVWSKYSLQGKRGTRKKERFRVKQ